MKIREINDPEDLNGAMQDIVQGIEEKIAPLKKDMDATINGFEQLQTQVKTNRFNGNNSPNKSLGALIAKGMQENTDNLAALSRGEIKTFSFQIKAADMLTTGITNLEGALSPAAPPVVGMPGENRHVRDMLNKIGMTGSSLPLLIETGTDGEPEPTSEGALKPQMDFTLSELNAKAQVIAAWTRVSNQFLEDIPAAQAWLTQRLIQSYYEAEDRQLINGTGVDPELKGINTAGNFTAASGGGTNPVIQLVNAVLQLKSLGRRPTGIIVHPDSLGSLLLNQADGSGEFDLPSYISVNAFGDLSVLGVPVLVTTAQTAAVFTVIDNSGMLLAIRNNVKVEFFASDGINVRENMVTARVEGRIAFPVYASTYAVKGIFDGDS